MVPLYKSWIHNSNKCKQLIKVQTHATWRTTCMIDASIIMAAWVQFRNEDIQRNWRQDRPVIVNNNWTNPNPIFLHPLKKYFEIGKSLSQNKNMKYFAVWEALEISISAYILSDNNFAWHVFNTGCLSPSQTKSRYTCLIIFSPWDFSAPLINQWTQCLVVYSSWSWPSRETLQAIHGEEFAFCMAKGVSSCHVRFHQCWWLEWCNEFSK